MKPSTVSYGFLLSNLATLFVFRFLEPDSALSMLLPFAMMSGVFVTGAALLRGRRLTGVIASASVGILIGVISVQYSVHHTETHDIERYAEGKRVSIHGWIVSPPDIRPTVTKLTVAADLIGEAGSGSTVRGRVLVNVTGVIWPEVRYGDEVRVEGALSVPEPIEDFDYPHYLELSGIRTLMTRGSVSKVKEGAAPPPEVRIWRMVGILTDVRIGLENHIGLILPEPHASLLAGLLTGTRRGLPAHTTDDFRTAGITHIIAVSGFNVTIVLVLLGGLLFWIPARMRTFALALCAVGFCIFVGGGAPVVRATIMGILGLFALTMQRTVTVRLSILWTAFFMTMLHPATLWYDASFQLSFLAVIGMSELSAPISRLLRSVPETFAIRESLVATIAAQITTIPLSMMLFGQFSLVSPLTNVIVAPLIPLSMLAGTVSVLLSVIWIPLGMVTGYGTWLLLEIILKAAHLCASVPFAVIRF